MPERAARIRLWLVVAGAAGVIALALLALVVVRWWQASAASASTAPGDPLALALDRSLQRQASPGAPAIAIRPLAAAEEDSELGALAEGLCMLIAQRLARLGGVRVTACDSTKIALAGGLDDQHLARLLAADHLLAGRLERLPDARVKLTVTLVDVARGHRHWQHEGEYGAGELQAVPGQLAERTRAALRVADGGRPEPAMPPAAFEKYLQARQIAARATPTEVDQALQLLNEALALAPDSMAARLSQLRLRMSRLRFAPADERRDIERLVAQQQALLRESEALGRELLAGDRENSDAHALLANAAAQQRRWVIALRHVDAVIASPVRSAAALSTAAHLLAMAGYLRAALELLLDAARLDPLNATNHLNLALFHGLLGDTARMRESARIAQELGSRLAVVYNGIAALREKDWPQAEAATVDALRGAGVDDGWVGAFVRGAADPAVREQAAEALDALPRQLHIGMANFHWYYGWLGDTRRTLRAVMANLQWPVGIWASNLWWPELAHLRRAPEFATVIDNIGLPEVWRARGAPDLCEAGADGSWACR